MQNFLRYNVTMNSIPLSLYIHMPWCVKKCPYCDFNSHATKGELPETQYIDSLLNDLKEKTKISGSRCIQTIFIGGGTPSLISASAYERLFKNIQDILQLAPNLEITIEANPGTVEQQRFNAYRSIGINRLSLGIQSFDDAHLGQLGRIHSAKTAKAAIISAKQAGFHNINLDLMYGLPNQSIQQAINDLQCALDYKPQHLSWYQLTLEPNTLFYKHPPSLPNDDITWEMQTTGQQFLSQYGYQQYEISAYCVDNNYCEHNLNYWRFGDYIGIGAGAHSKISSGSNILRLHNTKNPRFYMDKDRAFVTESKSIPQPERPLEFMMNNLRLNEAITYQLFQERTAIAVEKIFPSLRLLEKQNFIVIGPDAFQITPFGHRFLNEVLIQF